MHALYCTATWVIYIAKGGIPCRRFEGSVAAIRQDMLFQYQGHQTDRVFHIKLSQQTFPIPFHSFNAEVQAVGNLRIGKTLADIMENALFRNGEAHGLAG